MSSDGTPHLYADRILWSALKAQDPELFETMSEWQIGRAQQEGQIQFCGMVRAPSGRISVFLPRGANGTAQAAQTMAALAQFGKNSEHRNFMTDGDKDNPGLLAVIARLAADFRRDGIFSERIRVKARNTGKPNWSRTIVRGRGFPDTRGDALYSDILTTRAIDSHDTLLAQIQAVVIREILEQHSWWLTGLKERRQMLRGIRIPQQDRRFWPKYLQAILPSLYSNRSILLVRLLERYLLGTRASDSGRFVFGVEDFHTVWEAMLRSTLKGVETGWNAKLPKAVYIREGDGAVEASDRRMLTDIILRQGSNITIVDAKYYDGFAGGSLPGWSDIAKQFLYEKALRSVVGPSVQIRNFFVFPAPAHKVPIFAKVQMRKAGEVIGIATFGEIHCLYLPMSKIMECYVNYTEIQLS